MCQTKDELLCVYTDALNALRDHLRLQAAVFLASGPGYDRLDSQIGAAGLRK